VSGLEALVVKSMSLWTWAWTVAGIRGALEIEAEPEHVRAVNLGQVVHDLPESGIAVRRTNKTGIGDRADRLAIPAETQAGDVAGVLALGYSSGVLMPDVARVIASPLGAMVRRPAQFPNTNSFTTVGPKFLVSEMLGTLPGPVFRSVIASGQFHEAVVVP